MDGSVLLWHIGSIALRTRIVYRTTYEFIQHFLFDKVSICWALFYIRCSPRTAHSVPTLTYTKSANLILLKMYRSSSFSVYDITSLNLYRHTLTLSSHKNTTPTTKPRHDVYTAHESQQFKRIKAEYRDYVMWKKFSNLRNWNAQWLVCLLFQNFLKFILYVANKTNCVLDIRYTEIPLQAKVSEKKCT